MNLTEMTDAELDRLAAERMLGWTCDDVSCHDCSFKVFHPAIDMNDAMWFAEKVGLFDGGWKLGKVPFKDKWQLTDAMLYIVTDCDTPARAITEACLLATEGK